MQGREEPVAAAIAGEHPPGAIGAVRRRCEPHNEDLRLRVAKPGDGPTPVLLIAVRRPALARDVFAPGNEARAGAALDDLGVELDER
jgi:hypothetical protein